MLISYRTQGAVTAITAEQEVNSEVYVVPGVLTPEQIALAFEQGGGCSEATGEALGAGHYALAHNRTYAEVSAIDSVYKEKEFDGPSAMAEALEYLLSKI